MNSSMCRHLLVGTLATRHTREQLGVTRCLQHSLEGVSVWVWGADARAGEGCLCGSGDRFLVAGEGCAARWKQSADVVLGRPQPTVSRAVGVAEASLASFPGCTLVTVSAGKSGTVFRTRAEEVLLSKPGQAEVCAVCVYPSLAAGYRVDDLVKLFTPAE
jgi:hypothetical protein